LDGGEAMKIKGEKNDLFCYHFSRAPFCRAGDEALNIYCQIVIRALSYEKDNLIYANASTLDEEIKMTEESPLGILTWQEQVAAINACLLAIFHPGYNAENFILEQVFTTAIQNDIENALEFMEQDDDRLISWSRVFAMLEEKEGLEIPSRDDIGWLIECMTWDDDFALFQLTPESIYEVRQELKIYNDYPALECIPEYEDNFWNCYQWDKLQLKQLGEQNAMPLVLEENRPRGPIKEKPGEGFVYCIKECGGHLKVGKTTKTPNKRLKALQTSNPKILELCFAIRHKEYNSIEKQIHEALKKYRVAGEWFNCGIEKVWQHFKNISDAEWIEGSCS
jgi:hypothetical protein